MGYEISAIRSLWSALISADHFKIFYFLIRFWLTKVKLARPGHRVPGLRLVDRVAGLKMTRSQSARDQVLRLKVYKQGWSDRALLVWGRRRQGPSQIRRGSGTGVQWPETVRGTGLMTRPKWSISGLKLGH